MLLSAFSALFRVCVLFFFFTFSHYKNNDLLHLSLFSPFSQKFCPQKNMRGIVCLAVSFFRIFSRMCFVFFSPFSHYKNNDLLHFSVFFHIFPKSFAPEKSDASIVFYTSLEQIGGPNFEETRGKGGGQARPFL